MHACKSKRYIYYSNLWKRRNPTPSSLRDKPKALGFLVEQCFGMIVDKTTKNSGCGVLLCGRRNGHYCSLADAVTPVAASSAERCSSNTKQERRRKQNVRHRNKTTQHEHKQFSNKSKEQAVWNAIDLQWHP